MADIDLKTATPDTSLPTTGFLFGADSQASASPSVYSIQTVATTLLGSTSLTGASITTSQPVLDLSQTWNASGVTFTGLRFNADTGSSANSAAGSLLMDLQLEGSSKFKVSKTGAVNATSAFRADGATANDYVSVGSSSIYISTNATGGRFEISANDGGNLSRISQSANGYFGWSNNNNLNSGATPDTILTRRGPANLRLGAADTGAVTSTVTITIAAPGVVTWTSHGFSTGTPVVFTTTGALPTGITAGTTYYAVVVDANTFQIASSVANAIATPATVITTSGTQSGTHTGTRYNITQRLGMQSNTGVTDRLGADLIIQGSQGTGTGAGGSIIFQVAPASAVSNGVQNALATALTIDSTKTVRANKWQGLDNSQTSIAHDYNSLVIIGCASPTATLTGSTSGWSFSDVPVSINGALLRGDAANTLALRNANNGQTFRVYGRFTDITNDFERFFINAPTTSGAAVQLGTQKGATTGAARALEFQTDGVTALTIGSDQNITLNGGAAKGLFLGPSGSVRQYTSTAMAFYDSTGVARSFVGGSVSASFGILDDGPFTMGSSNDVQMYRDGANYTLALRNGANAFEQRIYASYTSTSNYQRMSIKTLRESSGALSGASYTTTIAIPAYAHLVGVTTRVTTAITGATTYDVGDGTDVDLWGAAIGIALGSQSRTANFTAVGAVGAAATSRTVTLTANGSNFTGGVVEICLHYLTTEAD